MATTSWYCNEMKVHIQSHDDYLNIKDLNLEYDFLKVHPYKMSQNNDEIQKKFEHNFEYLINRRETISEINETTNSFTAIENILEETSNENEFSDVTLACDEHSIEAHRAIISERVDSVENNVITGDNPHSINNSADTSDQSSETTEENNPLQNDSQNEEYELIDCEANIEHIISENPNIIENESLSNKQAKESYCNKCDFKSTQKEHMIEHIKSTHEGEQIPNDKNVNVDQITIYNENPNTNNPDTSQTETTDENLVDSNETIDQTPSNTSRYKKNRRFIKKSKYKRKQRTNANKKINLIHNFSSLTLSEQAKSLLNKGLNFCPTPKSVNTTQLLADMYRMERKFSWRHFYFGASNETSAKKNEFSWAVIR